MPDALPAMEAAARAAAQMSDALPMVPASTEPTVASAISSELAVDEPAADGDGGPDDDLQPVPAPKNETPVQKLLGEATMHYAYREWNQAVTMLLEVIRLSPAMPHRRTLSAMMLTLTFIVVMVYADPYRSATDSRAKASTRVFVASFAARSTAAAADAVNQADSHCALCVPTHWM